MHVYIYLFKKRQKINFYDVRVKWNGSDAYIVLDL